LNDLTVLPNIGKALAAELERAGVGTPEDLKKLGSIKATLLVTVGGRKACYNLLFALEGAIRGVRWHSIPREERTELKKGLDRARAARALCRSGPD
jgi:DNA transformation protein